MQNVVRPIAEILFTSYLVPALLLPLVWIAGAWRRRRAAAAGGEAGPNPRRWFTLHGGLSAALIAAWLAGALGVPIEHGGAAITLAAWLAFVALQLSFAALGVAVTRDVSAAPEGEPRDRLFAAFLGFTLLQPVGTAAALGVLYRLMRLVYHQTLPMLDVVPEGI